MKNMNQEGTQQLLFPPLQYAMTTASTTGVTNWWGEATQGAELLFLPHLGGSDTLTWQPPVFGPLGMHARPQVLQVGYTGMLWCGMCYSCGSELQVKWLGM